MAAGNAWAGTMTTGAAPRPAFRAAPAPPAGAARRRLLDFLAAEAARAEAALGGPAQRCTHVSIARPGRSYFLLGDADEAFLRLYAAALAEEVEDDPDTHLHLMEMHASSGPLVVDLDFRRAPAPDERADVDGSGELAAPAAPPRRAFRPADADAFLRLLLGELARAAPALDTEADVLVLAKPAPSLDARSGLVKDGLHFVAPALVTAPDLQLLLRRRALAACGALFRDAFGAENAPSDVYDECVIQRNGWQLLGSRKPGGKPYRIVRALSARIAGGRLLWLRELPPDSAWLCAPPSELAPRLSVRACAAPCVAEHELAEDVAAELAAERARRRDEVARRVVEAQAAEGGTTAELSDAEARRAAQLVGCLSVARADNYSDWILVGLALSNIRHTDEFLALWDEFSARSPRYEPGCCARHWRTFRPGGLGLRALARWARADDPQQFAAVMADDADALLAAALSGSHTDVAALFKHHFGADFVCAGLTTNEWWRFQGHRWQSTNGAQALRVALSGEFADLLTRAAEQRRQRARELRATHLREAAARRAQRAQAAAEAAAEAAQQAAANVAAAGAGATPDASPTGSAGSGRGAGAGGGRRRPREQGAADAQPRRAAQRRRTAEREQADEPADPLDEEADQVADEAARLENEAGQCEALAHRLKLQQFKADMVKELAEQLYDARFNEQLDSRPHLLGFENGVWDFSDGCFRDGRPDDFLSFSTGLRFLPEHDYPPGVPEAIDAYLAQVFVDRALREYVLHTLAGVLYGCNCRELFHFFTGSGSNSKSLLVSFFESCIGQYACKLPIALLTQKRAASNAATSEIARVRGKRFAVLQEPGHNETLSTGLMKELSGGDKIICRELYKLPVEFRPQMAMFLTCNVLPSVPSADDGTWRRIRVVEFASKFVEGGRAALPDGAAPATPVFALDRELPRRMQSWRETFISMLLLRWYRADGAFGTPPCVMQATQLYQQAQDAVAEWINETYERGAETDVLEVDVVTRAYVAEVELRERRRINRSDAIARLARVLGQPEGAAAGRARGVWRGWRARNQLAADDII